MTRYYRKVLNKGNNILKIRDELDLIVEYFNIMGYSHASEYKLVVEVDENLLDCHTIKLILQPLVENAIQHGLNGKEGEKRIIIKGKKLDGNIVLSVEDNSYRKYIETMQRVSNLEYENSFGGYGIKNLISRIVTFYGEQSKINIESEPGKYTRISLTLPQLAQQELFFLNNNESYR